MDVSIIVPVYNASLWLPECLQSVLDQKFEGKFQLSVFDDSSTDDSLAICRSWQSKFEDVGIDVVIGGHKSDKPKGVGFAKNRAVEQSSGECLCFLDADDSMDKYRLQLQWNAAQKCKNAIIGCKFTRLPSDSTARYTKWANALTKEQLYTQIYTSHGPTLIMPTWFCHRNVFLQVGGFSELGKGTPEDLIFFFAHLDEGGELYRVDTYCLEYRYHSSATSFSILDETIWKIRLQEFEKNVLQHWDSFTIWNAGKEGRRLYRSMSESNQRKVKAFCDVDQKKISKGIYIYEESKSALKPTVPIVHFKDAKPPFVICVKLDLTGGSFEKNLNSLNLKEGVDYYHFA